MSGRPVTSPFTVNRQRSPSPAVRRLAYTNTPSLPLPDATSPRKSGSPRPLSPVGWNGAEESGLEEEEGDSGPGHRPTCPRSKSRSRSVGRPPTATANTDPASVCLHPKPWGARDPSDIKCFCFVQPRTAGLGKRNRSPVKGAPSDTHVKRLVTERAGSKCPDVKPRFPSLGPAQEAKRNKLLSECCQELGARVHRQFGKVTEKELNFVIEKIKKILGTSSDEAKRKTSLAVANPSGANRRTVSKQELMGASEAKKGKQSHPYVNPATVSLAAVKLDDGSPSTKPSLTGKVEQNQYMIELSANTTVTNLRELIGTLNDTMIESNYHGDTETGPKYSIVNKTVYAELPENYNRLALLGKPSHDSNKLAPTKTPLGSFGGKQDLRSAHGKDIRVRQDINRQNYTFYVENNKQKFTKRLSNTQAEMYINPHNKGVAMSNKNHSDMSPVAKIYYVQNDLPAVKPMPRPLSRAKRM